MYELTWSIEDDGIVKKYDGQISLSKDIEKFDKLELSLGSARINFKCGSQKFSCDAVKQYSITSSGEKSFLGLSVKLYPNGDKRMSFVIDITNRNTISIWEAAELSEFQKRLGYKLVNLKNNEYFKIQLNGKYIVDYKKLRN